MLISCPRCHTSNSSEASRCSQCGTELFASGDEPTLDEAPASLHPPLQTPGSELTVGTILRSKYRVLGEVARGGMGVVYKAQDLKLERTVALKFLSPELTCEPEARERFVREAQAASELDHPNICTVFEIDETEGGQMYIAMAYYKGESLKEKIQRGALRIEEALDITLQLARGLAKAHQQGIVHRDIKPANVLLTEDGLVKIVDFGLARLTTGTPVTRTGTTLGTVAYMSPEQAQGQAVDQHTDLWSLGVVLYEMLAGQLPFKGESLASILYSVVHEPPQRLKNLKPDVPPELEHAVRHALEKKIEARYASAEEVVKDLEGYQQTLHMMESGAWNFRLLARRARTPRVAIPLVLFVCLVTLLGVWLFRRQAKIRWAREVALPKIEQKIAANDVWRNLTGAYALAVEAERYIPRDRKLAELFSKCSLNINVKTQPPGARIYMKEYKTPEAEWKYLGVSPLEKIRVPIGVFRWKIEKEGYETILAASSSWGVNVSKASPIIPNDLERTLDKKGSIPPGMVRVTGGQTDVGKLPDFFIDKYEVTNKQYKEFINQGGYGNQKYWKHLFVKAGKVLTWGQAMAEFVDQTGRPGPATWQAGGVPEGQGEYPVSGISWYEAAAYAEFAGKTLPTGAHWGLARGEDTTLIQVPQLGGFAIFAPFSNFNVKGPVPAGSLPGITPYGAYDMAGNVREWCLNDTLQGKLVRGGSWDDNAYQFDNPSQAPPFDRSPHNGFRCALYPDPTKVSSSAFQMVKWTGVPLLAGTISFSRTEPVPDSVFRAYKEQFSYDPTPLEAEVEWKRQRPDWTEERITFNAAYGQERIIAYLFLPKSVPPPFQTVVYFPGSNPLFVRSSADLEHFSEFILFVSFIVKNGRAVLFPVYKGTFERGNDQLAELINLPKNAGTHQYAEYFIQVVKDFRRCIDYLQTRQDIDGQKLAYYGMSWGGEYGAIIPAVESRLKASVLVAGGLSGWGRPEVNPVNYAPHVKIPTLMLNGRYDTLGPPQISQKPMFELLGTPAADKQWKLYDTDHIPPRNEYIKETLAWFDRYLGPVR
jgi:dienelactone hydrolase